MPRVYERKFDWDEARRLRASDPKVWTYPTLGTRFGVSATAVRLACDDEARAVAHERHAAWQRQGSCPDCGAQTTLHRRCVRCAMRVRATSVRPAVLQCVTCRVWKPDEAFTQGKTNLARRLRHSQCTACQTAARIAYRQRNRTADRAYQRDRKRKLGHVRLAQSVDGVCSGCGAPRDGYHRRACQFAAINAGQVAA